jgi:hypothetical protein
MASSRPDDERNLRQAETRAIHKLKAATPKEPPKRMATDKPFRGFRQPPERQNGKNTLLLIACIFELKFSLTCIRTVQ